MGTPVPSDWPEIDPLQFYLVTVDAFWGNGGATDCERPNTVRIECCRDGADVNNWIANDWDCTDGLEMCLFSGFSAQRLVAIHGPYALRPDCLADL